MGTIRTLQGLDYERDIQHVLVIGTKENMSNKPGATTKVIIYVQVSMFHGKLLVFKETDFYIIFNETEML